MAEQTAESKTAAPVEPSLVLETSPHIRYGESVRSVMLWVIVALIPAMSVSALFFGPRALVITAISVAAALLTELLITKAFNRPSSIGDLSVVVTGILVAFNVPPNIPWWMPALGSVFAIGVAKLAFGGLGNNFINPALAGRAFLMASYPAAMTTFRGESLLKGVIDGIDGTSGATPLAHIKDAVASGTFQPLAFEEALPNLFLGNVGGCIGETSAAALLIGALFLLYKRVIGFGIPVSYIGSVFVLFWLFNGTGGWFTSDALIVPVYHVLAGGLMLGALYMATDMVTSPITPRGRILFGLGCGALTFLIRRFGGYPEGVSYSILLMNCVVPLIDRHMRPKRYGEVRKRD